MISTIIVNYNTRQLTLALIESIYRNVRSTPFEICVVDNASVDGSADAVLRKFPDVILLESEGNLGFGLAVNLALPECKGEYLWLINSDCLVKRDIVSVMTDYLDHHPETAAVAGRLISEDGTFQASCRRFPSFGNILLSRQSPLTLLLRSNDRYTLPDYTEPTMVDTCACTNVMIRRRSFEEADGFDPRFFMYCEDIDLCIRLAQRNWNVVYLPDAEVIHRWGESWNRSVLQRYYHHHRSIVRLFRKHFAERKSTLFVFELVQVLGVGIRAAFSLLRRPR